MLITTSLAAVVFVSALAGAVAPVTPSIPPMVVTVATASTVSPTLVMRVLEEADAVWRAAGVTFVWRRVAGEPVSRARDVEPRPCESPTLHVVIGRDRGADADHRRENGKMALGWIVFDERDAPDPEIYLSHENAEAYMRESRIVIGLTQQKPIAEREMLLARAMGRALAHEIGHYLLASRVHTARGLMQATHTASDFFGADRASFNIDAAQRITVAARLGQERLVVNR
jgi:hypothetical protein